QLEGADFVAGIYGSTGGWSGVNEVYSRPPVSTEQVLHPEKFLSNEQPVIPELPELAGVLGRGWEVISENTMGEFLIRTYVEEHIERGAASIAADGWSGDRFALLNGPEAQRVFALLVRWDTPEDAEEFFETYEAFGDLATGVEAIASGGDSPSLLWVGDKQAVMLDNSGADTLLVIGDSRPLVEMTAAAIGGF
ncbi:MAG: hypothetical protein ACRDIB_08675, partial [Ardenticatenaceae bacterium]